MDFTGVIAKINPFFIILTEISLYFEAEKVPLFRKNLVRACSPLGHLRRGRDITIDQSIFIKNSFNPSNIVCDF
jgi:hypothetical protein